MGAVAVLKLFKPSNILSSLVRITFLTEVDEGRLKIHIAVDEETKEIISLEITDESVSDGDKFRDIVEESGRNSGTILEVHGDGAYDTKDNFNILKEDGIWNKD